MTFETDVALLTELTLKRYGKKKGLKQADIRIAVWVDDPWMASFWVAARPLIEAAPDTEATIKEHKKFVNPTSDQWRMSTYKDRKARMEDDLETV